MASDKSIIGLALLAKLEASYNSGGTLSTSTDGIQVATLPEFDLAYTFDGARPTPPGTAGGQLRTTPSGRTATAKISIEAKGAGTAYSTSSVPPMHVFLRASGLSASLVSGTSYTYVPDPAQMTTYTPASLVMGVYRRGELWVMSGSYCNFTLGTSNAAPPIFEFDTQAVASAPIDTSLPVITYPYSSVIPPKAESIGLSINSVSALQVRSFKFELGRQLQARNDLNSSLGTAGFAPGRREPKLTVVIEAEPLSRIDPYNLQVSSTSVPVSLTIGSVAFNKYTISLPQAQITNVKTGADGPIATWELTIMAGQSTPTTNDDFSILFN